MVLLTGSRFFSRSNRNIAKHQDERDGHLREKPRASGQKYGGRRTLNSGLAESLQNQAPTNLKGPVPPPPTGFGPVLGLPYSPLGRWISMKVGVNF